MARFRAMVTGYQVVGPLIVLICSSLYPQTCSGQGLQVKDPPCPLDMDKVLPTAGYSGPLQCSSSSSNTAQESGGKCVGLAGKVALVTGASTGLGRGIADRLAAAGMKVIGTSRNPELYTGNCVYTKPGDKCKPAGWQLWQMDQTSQESVDKLMQRIKDTYGHIDLLYLNAGRGYGSNSFKPNGKTWCNDIDQMKVVMDTNFWGPVRVLMAAQPLLPKQGYARVMITVSVAAWINIQGGLPYAASKAAAAVIGEEWLYEFYDKAASNVKFTGIYPGSMLSDLARKSVPGCKKQADAFENDWKQWEYGQYYLPNSVFITPAQGGEAIYRLATNPNPGRRYILNADRSTNYMKKRICTHLANPMDIWPKAYD